MARTTTSAAQARRERREKACISSPRMAAMDAQNARTRLESERTRLADLRTAVGDEGLRGDMTANAITESTQAQHQADIGTETHDRERDLSVLESVEAELADVEHALRRIDDGTYGR